MSKAELLAGAWLALLMTAACSSEIRGGAAADGDGGASSGAGGKSAASSSSSGNGSGTTGSGATAAVSDGDTATRVARLTHAQYDATVQDLLGIKDSLAAQFAPDALNGFAFDTSIDLEVDARLGPQYRAAAEALAERVVSEPAVFDHVVTCDAADASCPEQFVAEFGQRAFRRPLNDDERARFMTLFEQGATLIDSGDAFADGVQLVVEAMLQSPQFLYRTELSDQVGDSGTIALNDWEIASRLSYFLHGSMPTEALFARAAAGELSSTEQVENVLGELLSDERAMKQLVSFHAQAWDFARFSRITPDRDTYPDAPDDIVASVRAASDRFVQDVIDAGGGLRELLTAPYAYADDGLAPLYGEAGVSGLVRIELDPAERKGFLMQIGFLASHAYAIDTDPIHRGLFVVRELLCRKIPDPPPGASMTPLPETDEPIETTREEVELLTGQTGCANCHQQINPPGFAFEGFDAVGQIRTTENGVPVDTSGTFVIDGSELAFAGPVELVDAVADSEEARACYAAKWLEFAYGRRLSESDADAVAQLSVPISVNQLVARLITTQGFLTRKPNEVAQ